MIIGQDEVKLFPSVILVAELHIIDGFSSCCNNFIKVDAPYFRAWGAMTYKIYGGKIVIWLFEKLMQTCYLARCSREEHFTTFGEESFGIDIGSLHTSLDILRTHEGLYAFHVFSIVYHHLPLLIKACTKDYSTLADGLLCQDMENATRRGMHSNHIVLVSGS